MKIFSGILGGFLLILTLCFALSNQQSVSVTMWPLAGALDMPLYVAGLGPLVVGLFFGAALGWLTGLPHRLRARRLGKELNVLNGRIDDLQKISLVQQVQTEKKKPFWERKA